MAGVAGVVGVAAGVATVAAGAAEADMADTAATALPVGADIAAAPPASVIPQAHTAWRTTV
jgi:hypothetical protein